MDARTHAVAEALAEVRFTRSPAPRLLAENLEREATEFLAMLKAVRDFDREIVMTEGR